MEIALQLTEVQTACQLIHFFRTLLGNSFGVSRYNADGSLDSSFGSGGKQVIDFPGLAFGTGVALEADGSVVVIGTVYSYFAPGYSNEDFAVARLTPAGQLDASFGIGGKTIIDFGGFTERATSVALQLDGSVVVGGISLQGGVGSFAVARLMPSGQFDPSFGSGGKQTINIINSFINTGPSVGVGLQPDGSIVVAGGGGAGFVVARLTASGQPDPSFGSGGNQTIHFGSPDSYNNFSGVAVRADGSVVVASYFQGFGVDDFGVARLTAAGQLDPTFGTAGKVTIDFSGGDDREPRVVLKSDGSVVVAGISYRPSGEGIAVARLTAAGQLDSSFGSGGKQISISDITDVGYGLGLVLQSDDSVVVAGSSGQGNAWDFRVARLTAAGQLDASFGSGGEITTDFQTTRSDERGRSAVVAQDGKIVVVGSSSSFSTDLAVARYNPDRSLDPSFGNGGKQTIATLIDARLTTPVAVEPDGSIVVAGTSFLPNPNTFFDFVVIRLTPAGQLDASFGDGGTKTIDFSTQDDLDFFGGSDDRATGVTAQLDGSIAVIGTSFGSNGQVTAVAKLTPAGQLDPSFGNGGKQVSGPSSVTPTAAAVQADGKSIVVGTSDPGATGANFLVRRYNTDGSLDTSFGNAGTVTIDFGPGDDVATSVALQADGNVVVGGYSYQGNTGFDFAVARLLQEDNLSLVGTAGDDVISVTPGTEAGTLKATVNGSVTDNIAFSGAVFVAGLGGNDTISISASLVGGLVVDGQDGSDSYAVSFGNLAGAVSVRDSGITGTDTLTVIGTPGDDVIGVKNGTVTWGNPVAEAVGYSGVESTTVDGGAGNDTITDPNGGSLTLLGGSGNDTIIIQDTTGGGVTADGGTGSDTYIVNAGNLQVPVSIRDTGTTGTDSLTVNGTAGDDTIAQSGAQIIADGGTINLGSGLDSLTVDGGGGAGDTYTVQGNPVLVATVQGVSATVVQGTAGDDHIILNPGNSAGEVKVRVNGVLVGTFRPNGRMVFRGLAGDDDIQVAGSINVEMWLYGDEGDDRLKGGDGNNVLIGGNGDDLLVGGNSRDIIIGGAGADRLVGNAQDDILIAGSTTFDGNGLALSAILAEWTSNRSYAVRVANLNGTGTGSDYSNRLNGETFLRVTNELGTTTVFDDGSADVLTGSSGMDWYFANIYGSGTRDKITDLSASEFANDLSFILGP